MAVPAKLTFYKDNDQYLEIDGLTDGVTNAYINAATVTATLYDPSGTAVPGFTAVPLPYVAASSGVYRGLIVNTFAPPQLGGGYVVKLDVINGAYKLHMEIKAEVRTRTS